jgi:hypothetical protein
MQACGRCGTMQRISNAPVLRPKLRRMPMFLHPRLPGSWGDPKHTPAPAGLPGPTRPHGVFLHSETGPLTPSSLSKTHLQN